MNMLKEKLEEYSGQNCNNLKSKINKALLVYNQKY